MVIKEVIYDIYINYFNEYKVIKDLLLGIYICFNLIDYDIIIII